MIPKLLLSGYNDSDMFPPSEIVPTFSKGFDKTVLEKRASMFIDIIPTFERKPGYEYIHLISVADGCTYGPNSRSDFYNGEPCEIKIPYPEKGSPSVVVLDGGISKYHNTFMKSGGVYTEHRNKHSKNPPKSQGYIVAQAYNQPMKRGELIIGVNDEAWHDDLERLSNGTPLKFSIGFDATRDTCFPAGTLVLTEHGYIPIDVVQPGDLVMTDDGSWQEVLTVMDRLADDYTSIQVYGLPLPIESTSNHPFEIVPQEQIKSCGGSTGKYKTYPRHTPDENGICRRCGKPVDLTPRWLPAEEVRIHDYLKTPVDSCNENITVGTAFAYLAGMYVGDGSIVFSHYGHAGEAEEKRAAGVSFSCSAAEKDKPILDKILKLVPSVCGAQPLVAPESGGKKAYRVTVNDSLFAHKLLSLFGHGTYHKSIDHSVLSWSIAEKSAFIAGYVDSDGYVNNKSKLGVTIVSVNRALLLCVQRMAWSIGMPVTCGRHSSAKFIQKFNCWGKESYHITFTSCAKELSAESVKIASIVGEFKTKWDGPTILIHNGYAYLRVVDRTSWVGDARRVYNIEVADRHTYIAEGVSVHNCSRCGHIAHTEDEHCEHVKNNVGQWDKDGNVICMISDQGVYHDISRVRVPAEKIAFSLKKVASGVTDTELEEPSVNPDALQYILKSAAALKRYKTVQKLAKLEKRLDAIAKNDKLNKELLKSFGHQKKASEDAIDELHKFIEFAHEKEVFGGLKRCKCILSPSEFLQLIAPNLNTPRNVQIIQGGMPGIFNDTWQRADLDEFCEDTTYTPEPCLDLRIIRPIMRLEPQISVDTDLRLNQMLSGLQSQPNAIIICIKNKPNDLSREYASYLTDACSDLDDQESMLALLRALTQQGN